jgi:predicted nuclease of predicted toxin-antitoxin system
MRILLDENFPIQLYRRLQESGHAAEHIIALGLRGISDEQIRRRLAVEADLLFLTQDTEFADLPSETAATIMISRVPQSMPIAQRVEVWLHAIAAFLEHPSPGTLFELLPDGRVVEWEIRNL